MRMLAAIVLMCSVSTPALAQVSRDTLADAVDSAIGNNPQLMAERHGTPIAQTLEQLALDVRERRRRQAEADARKLPIRMSFPLVVCTLPSFVLIAIVPAVLAAMASLGNTGF